jgi:hypothetical protein
VEESVLDEPIQISKVEVTGFSVGSGVELTRTDFAKPMPVASDDLTGDFPAPLEMPPIDIQVLQPSLGDQPMISMPELPTMPIIDWAEVAPPMPKVPTIEDIPAEKEND